MPIPLTESCLTFAASRLNVNLALNVKVAALLGLLSTEGGTVGQSVPNKNDQGVIVSRDHGPFQINDSWLKPLKAFFALSSEEETKDLIVNNGCANAIAAASILSYEAQKANGDLIAAIGHYHSHTPSRANSYRVRVANNLTRLQRKGGIEQALNSPPTSSRSTPLPAVPYTQNTIRAAEAQSSIFPKFHEGD